jgi:hypothetical protein
MSDDEMKDKILHLYNIMTSFYFLGHVKGWQGQNTKTMLFYIKLSN